MSQTPIPQAFLRWGHLQTRLDPFGGLQPQFHPDLQAALLAVAFAPTRLAAANATPARKVS